MEVCYYSKYARLIITASLAFAVPNVREVRNISSVCLSSFTSLCCKYTEQISHTHTLSTLRHRRAVWLTSGYRVGFQQYWNKFTPPFAILLFFTFNFIIHVNNAR